MPFTISHAGFVLPLKKQLSQHLLFALMIGSIVPDFGYFIRQFGIASYAHTIVGALMISVPVGAALYLILTFGFQRLVEVLPNPHRGFLSTWDLYQRTAEPKFITVLVTIFLGALSHNFVDSFTHHSGQALAWFPGLARVAFTLNDETFHVYRVLQYLGSALGMVMLLIYYVAELRLYCLSKRMSMWQDSAAWVTLLMIAVLSAVIAAFLNLHWLAGDLTFYAFRAFGFKFLITWLPLLGIAFLGLALLRSKRSR